MMNFLSVRCLNCNNIDEFPRLDYDEIPYCSQSLFPTSSSSTITNIPWQCAATSNLVPATPPTKAQVQPQQWTGGDDLANLFSRNLSLLDQPVTPPMSPPSNVNFSVSQHYTHPTAFRPPTPQQHQAQLDSQIMSEASSSLTTADQEKAYIQYLLNSNLGSETSQNDLEIALAHGIIDQADYTRAISIHNQLLQQRGHEALMLQQREHQEAENLMVQSQLFSEMQAMQMGGQIGRGLDEDCSAHSLLSAASRQKSDPVFRTAEFFNDYYGGVDASYAYEDDDESAPCSVYTGGAGYRLRPFDL